MGCTGVHVHVRVRVQRQGTVGGNIFSIGGISNFFTNPNASLKAGLTVLKPNKFGLKSTTVKLREVGPREKACRLRRVTVCF